MATHPPWLIVRRGTAPILLLAPHGGRRRDLRIPGRHKVNDLHTGDVTRKLARRLGASIVINEHVDRNVIDLNRTHQVRRDAPWLLEVVAEIVGGMLADAGRAVVLVVHGWNVGQVACDVGIGALEGPMGLVPARAGSVTASDAFVEGCLHPLRALVAPDRVVVTIGSRYPAAHPNNLLQIFGTTDEGAEVSCPVRALRGAGRLEAAQLELAIPLRWPGHRRDRFLANLASAVTGFVAGSGRPRRASGPPGVAVGSGRLTRRRALQFTAGELLVMASIDAGDGGPIGGRLVVSESPTRLALFTGELVDVGGEWQVPPLVCEMGTGVALRFVYDGPLVVFPTHTPFLDLERGLAEGRLVEGHLDVWFRGEHSVDARDGEQFGEVRGEISIDGRRYDVACRGLANVTDGVVRARVPHGRIALLGADGGSLVLSTDTLEPTEDMNRWHARDLVGRRLTIDGDGDVRASAVIDVSSPGGMLVLEGTDDRSFPFSVSATLERVIPVRRPGVRDTVVETRFALVRAAGQVVGWTELSVVLGLPETVIPA